MPDLIPVDHDPFTEAPRDLVPVAHDPFAVGGLDMSSLMGERGVLAGGNYLPSPDPGPGVATAVPGVNMQELRERYGQIVREGHRLPTPLDLAIGLGGGPGGAPVAMAAAPARRLLAEGTASLRPARIGPGIKDAFGGEGYVYHATNLERAGEISQGGLKTHKPHEFTDQEVWPDGSVERRNYFTPTPENTWQFAPEEGQGVLLRVKRGPDIRRESTGDLYSRKAIDPSRIEMMHEDGKFYPIEDFFKEPPVPQGIRAYHGSPYDFEKFDISKIGTGEGAQAYGHGLYFAEAEGVARDYRNKLSPLKMDTGTWSPSEVSAALEPGNEQAAFHLAQRTGGWDKAIARLDEELARASPERRASVQEMRDAAVRLKELAPFEPAGKMYEVSISADPDHFLHWDKPLSEQSPKVQEAVTKVWKDNNLPGDPVKLTGEGALGSLQAASYKYGMPRGAGKEAATMDLRDAGIPGIKYLDQGSRGVIDLDSQRRSLARAETRLAKWKASDHPNAADQVAMYEREIEQHKKNIADATANPPTHNFVVFDDKLINVIKKYGIAGLIAGGGAHFATTPVDYDPFKQ